MYEICGPNEYSHAKECAQYHLPQFIFLRAVGIGDAHNGLITAVSTILLTWITFRLANMEVESGETQKAELRAYLSATAKGISVADDGETLTVYFEIKNAGQTPAFNVTVPSGMTFTPPPPHKFLLGNIGISDKQIDELSAVTLPKDGTITMAAYSKVTYADWISYLSKPQRFYVFALITYLDVFGDIQWVEFCTFLEVGRFAPFFDLAKKSPNEKVPVSFKVAEFGNDNSLSPQHSRQMAPFRRWFRKETARRRR